jgi:cytochrome b561
MGYTRTQVILHWLIVALVALQWLTHDAMEEAFEPLEDGVAGFLGFNIGSRVHLVGGVAVLLLVVLRFGLRLRRGTPPLPPELTAPLAWLARAVDWAFYAVLVLLPVSGLAAVLVNVDASDPHGLLFNLLAVLIVLHLAGVLFHSVVLRDGLIRRMLVPHRSGTG